MLCHVGVEKSTKACSWKKIRAQRLDNPQTCNGVNCENVDNIIYPEEEEDEVDTWETVYQITNEHDVHD